MDWIALINGTARKLEDLGPNDPAVLRQILYKRLRERLEFPLETNFEAVVKGDRRLRFPDRDEDDPYLELVPGPLDPHAYEILGGVLVGSEEPLDAGSIVEAVVEIDDPDRYLLKPPALMGRLEDLTVKVGVTA